MRVSFEWLKELVSLTCSPEELAGLFPHLGLGVEKVIKLGESLDKVVVGQILEIKPHPGADRLVLCQVNVGTANNLAIVCGAKNMQVHDKVPVALEGAELPGGIKIKRSKIRGEESEGMLCSAKELGLSEDAQGVLILKDGKLGDDIKETLGLHDVIFDLEVTPNRPDYLGVVGIARELAAFFKLPLKMPIFLVSESNKKASEAARVMIEDPDLCRRYAARVISNIKIGPSPEWLCRRLEAVGLRSVNSVVDVTNLVLFEWGHPLHAFDYNKVKDHQIVVRRAKKGEKLSLLDQSTKELNPQVLVIADSQNPLALAGIMGGTESAVSDSTEQILLESAYFNPATIRKTSKSLGVSSDSSYRFERGADPEGLIEALDRAARLIQEIAGGEIYQGRVDCYPQKFARKTISLRVGRANAFLGVQLASEEAQDILKRLSYKVSGKDPLKVEVPSFRRDITEEIDLVEDIAQLYGYGRIPTSLPRTFLLEKDLRNPVYIDIRIKRQLASYGLFEVVSGSLIYSKRIESLADSGEIVKIKNPLTEDRDALRPNLLVCLLDDLALNARQDQANLGIFELGKVFSAGQPIPRERKKMGIALMGFQERGEGVAYKDGDYFTLKGMIENLLGFLGLQEVAFQECKNPWFLPVCSAEIVVKGKKMGVLGEIPQSLLRKNDIKKRVFFSEIDLEEIYSMVNFNKVFKGWPKFPCVKRDVAVVVPKDLPAARVLDLIKTEGSPLVEEVSLFDVYEGASIPEDKKSLAFAISYRSKERTLTDAEVNQKHDLIVNKVKEKFQAQIRV